MRIAVALALWAVTGVVAWGAPLSADELNVLREYEPSYKSTYPSQAARQLAAKIGREGSIEKLRALIDLRNVVLLNTAVQSYDAGPSKQLPEALEALIIEHYADPLLQRPLLSLIGNRLDNYERFPRFRSRRLFELLYADLKKANNDRLWYAGRIVANDVKDIEPELVALLPVLAPSSANALVMFLGVRKFAPAVPALMALQARTPFERNENFLLQHINLALLQIGTPQAVQAVLDRVKALGRQSVDRAGQEISGILDNLKALPAGSPPQYAELRAALPEELSPYAWSALVKLVIARKEKRGIPDLILAMIRVPASDDAINALLGMGEPADWRVARAELERGDGAMTPGRRAALQKRLDDALADPTQFLAMRRQNERAQELQQSQTQFSEEKNRLAAFKSKEPQRYAAGLRALIERREALLRDYADLPSSVGPKQELAREYAELAAFLRFKLGQPDEAIAAYQARGRLQPAAAGGFDPTPLTIADIQRFDKRDPKKAVEQYQLAIAGLGSVSAQSGPLEGLPLRGLRNWIEREVAYLESGKTFSGAIGHEDLAVVQLWMWLSPMLQVEMDPVFYEAANRLREAARRGEKPPAAGSGLLRALDALPASQFQIPGAHTAVFQLPPEDILRFFAKHDPAGYLTAVLLAMAANPNPRGERGGLFRPEDAASGSAASVKSAAERFFRARDIRASLTPDPRYASPERTWALFLDSAKKGDATAMLGCFTAGMRAKLQELFAKMSREDLAKMAISIVKFSIQGGDDYYREAMILRESGDKKMAGFVYFVNDGGEWKIQSM